jgi:hypothetical protein
MVYSCKEWYDRYEIIIVLCLINVCYFYIAIHSNIAQSHHSLQPTIFLSLFYTNTDTAKNDDALYHTRIWLSFTFYTVLILSAIVRFDFLFALLNRANILRKPHSS